MGAAFGGHGKGLGDVPPDEEVGGVGRELLQLGALVGKFERELNGWK